jgi:hypothetical protein
MSASAGFFEFRIMPSSSCVCPRSDDSCIDSKKESFPSLSPTGRIHPNNKIIQMNENYDFVSMNVFCIFSSVLSAFYSLQYFISSTINNITVFLMKYEKSATTL